MIRIDSHDMQKAWAHKAGTLLITIFACGLSPLPTRAHDTPVTLDAATEHAGSIAMALSVTAIVGLAAYFATTAFCLAYERRKKTELDQKRTSASAVLFSIATMIPLWRLTMPAPIPVQHDTAPVRVVATPVTPEERKLYLTPGGLYTRADIAANGETTPEQKYAGMMANHHLNPKRGTYTCPITKTQANRNFAWIVNGKTYLFCCPPCIAEFVKQAKTTPHSIKEPQDYIQK